MLNRFSHVQFFATQWIVALQAPLSTGFSRQGYWRGLPCSSPGDLPDPGVKPMSLVSPAWAGSSLPLAPLGKPLLPISVQFSSVAQSSPTLCNPMNRITPSLSVQHQLLEFTQTHVHRVGDAIQSSHPLSSPSPPSPNPSQHQGLFQ